MKISELIAKLQVFQIVNGDLPVFVYDDEQAEWRLPKLTHMADGPVMSLPYLAEGHGVPGNPAEFLAIGYIE